MGARGNPSLTLASGACTVSRIKARRMGVRLTRQTAGRRNSAHIGVRSTGGNAVFVTLTSGPLVQFGEQNPKQNPVSRSLLDFGGDAGGAVGLLPPAAGCSGEETGPMHSTRAQPYIGHGCEGISLELFKSAHSQVDLQMVTQRPEGCGCKHEYEACHNGRSDPITVYGALAQSGGRRVFDP